VTVIEWDIDPLVPVTVTGYVSPAVEPVVETDSDELPDPPDVRETVDGLSDADGPAGKRVAVRLTEPEKSIPSRVTVSAPDVPA